MIRGNKNKRQKDNQLFSLMSLFNHFVVILIIVKVKSLKFKFEMGEMG